MKKTIKSLCLSGVMFLAAATAGGCSGQMMEVMSLLCPDCYANYLATTGQ